MNPFDQLDGYELNGLFSKIKKAVSKVTRPIEKAVATVRDKTLPANVAHELSKAAQNPIIKGAALGIATFVAAPLVISVAGGFGVSSGVTAGITGTTVATAAANGALTLLGETELGKYLQKRYGQKPVDIKAGIAEQRNAILNDPQLTQAQKQYFIQQLNAAYNVTDSAGANSAAATVNEIVNDQAMQSTVQNLVSDGMSKNQIVNTWVSSDAYKASAFTTAYNAIYYQVVEQVKAAGVPDAQVAQKASEIASQIANDAVNNVQSKSSNIPAAALLLLPLILFMM